MNNLWWVELWEVGKEAVVITSFVFMIMLVVEYANVQTRGQWQRLITGRRVNQYLIAALMGVMPGCLGSFAMVTFYTHGIVSLGALVTTMIATSGDEAFVMFARFPLQALWLNLILGGVGALTGWLVDLIADKYPIAIKKFHPLPLHDEPCACFQPSLILPQILKGSFPRLTLMAVFVFCSVGFGSGFMGPEEWNWVRVTLIVVSFVCLFIVATVPEHFLREHLWRHITLRHVPQVFGWILGTMLVIQFILNRVDIQQWLQQAPWTLLIIGALVGLVPESGPHLLFVNMYAQGMLPFSVLLANSIVQDGHGMLPLLAQSRRAFLLVKLINFIIGLGVGLIGLVLFK